MALRILVGLLNNKVSKDQLTLGSAGLEYTAFCTSESPRDFRVQNFTENS